MVAIQQNVNLKPYNTFGISALAKSFVQINTTEQLQQLSNEPIWEQKKLILGGGSNILLTQNFDGLVVQMNTKGIETVQETNDFVQLKVQAGENWHQFVLHCINNNWGGVENLSLIPGNVGTSPMQNIGAYGVEINQVFVQLTAFHIKTKQFHTFTNEQCQFGYRTSIFKTSQKGNYIITDVTFQLSKQPQLNISYGAIAQKLEEKGIQTPTIKNVSDVVIEIRQSKLPDPKQIGNSGSFFKNPIITEQQFKTFQQNYPNAPSYKVKNGIKVPAGWLIEQCGFKGKVIGNTGTYKNQALILVNHGNATGAEVWGLAQNIQKTVFETFNITIEPEVNLI